MKYNVIQVLEVNASGSEGNDNTSYSVNYHGAKIPDMSFQELVSLQQFLTSYIEKKKGGLQ